MMAMAAAVSLLEGSRDVKLPEGWEVSEDADGNVFYIDHNSKTTQWDPPAPQLVQDQESSRRTSETDSRTLHTSSSDTSSTLHDLSSFETEESRKLKTTQANMILKYLLAVQQDFRSKNEITETLQKRLELAGTESTSLKNLLTACTSSPTTPEKCALASSQVNKANSSRCEEEEVTKSKMGIVGFDVSSLTKQYLHSQKRLQLLKEELATRRLQGELKFNQCIGHLLKEKSLLMMHNNASTQASSTGPTVSSLSYPPSSSSASSPSSAYHDAHPHQLHSQSPRRRSTPTNSPANGTAQLLQTRLLDVGGEIEELLVQLAPLQPHSDQERLGVIQEKEQLLQEMLHCHQRHLLTTTTINNNNNSSSRGDSSRGAGLDVDKWWEESIARLRDEIRREKETCNVVMSQRLSLLEQKYELESEYSLLLEQLENLSVDLSETDQTSQLTTLNTATEPLPGNRSAKVSLPSQLTRPIMPQMPLDNFGKPLFDKNQSVFLSDVSPDKEIQGAPLFPFYTSKQGKGDQIVSRSSLRDRNISSVRDQSPVRMPRSQSFKNELSSYASTRAIEVATKNRESMYENIEYSPPTPGRREIRPPEEHNRAEAHYESVVYEDEQILRSSPSIRHERDDSGVAVYENIHSSPFVLNRKRMRDRDGASFSEHRKNSSSESSSNQPSYHSLSLKCKVLIDIKFTHDHQLHVRLEELKDLTMLQSVGGLQFSVELYSLDDPNFSLCQCSNFLANTDFEMGAATLIVNEFMAFDLPYNGHTDSCFLRVIMFCRPRIISHSPPENFLAELNLNLASVLRSQQMSRSRAQHAPHHGGHPTHGPPICSTASWYQLVMNETSSSHRMDYSSLQTPDRVLRRTAAESGQDQGQPNFSSIGNIYDTVCVSPDQLRSPVKQRTLNSVHNSSNEPSNLHPPPLASEVPPVVVGQLSRHLGDRGGGYPAVAHYSVKNTTMARLQPLSESQLNVYSCVSPNAPPPFSQSNATSSPFAPNVMQLDPLVTSDEGYDERAVDCDSTSSFGSSEYNRAGGGSNSSSQGFRRSATFCQSARTYSSFNSHKSLDVTSQQPCKLNRSESDSATQHYLLKPQMPPPHSASGVSSLSPSPTTPHHPHSHFNLPHYSTPSSHTASASTVPPKPPLPPNTLGSRFKRNAVERIPSKMKHKMFHVSVANSPPIITQGSFTGNSRFPGSSSPVAGSRLSPPSCSPSVVTNIAANVRRKLHNNINNGSG